MTDIASILACYRSGQISEADMVEICREWPEVEAALREGEKPKKRERRTYFSLGRDGLFVIFSRATDKRRAIGFKIKPASRMLFSERYGFARGFRLGPLWIGTYA